MAPQLEDYLEDSCIACEGCSGECDVLIRINGELVCVQCASGKRECA